MILALALASLQPAAAGGEAVPNCALTTPSGEVARFFIWGDDSPGRVRLTGSAESVWPAGTVVGTREEDPAALRFAIGGPDGLSLQLGQQVQGRRQRTATLFRREGGRPTLPVAYGYCEDQQVAVDPPEPGTDPNAVGVGIPAFDPAGWPDSDCGIILSDGRMTRLRFTIQPNDRVRLEGAGLWSDRPVAAGIRWVASGGVQVGTFSGDGGLTGVQFMFTSPSQAARAIRIENFGDPLLTDVSGYALCGYKHIERRPNAQ